MQVLGNSRSVIVVPGYGMAVAQAQHVIQELAELLAEQGIQVRYAIHPVAGRMPGHMNVLLAEAQVPYESLVEMDHINDDFQNTDTTIVVGANDVVNPAARHKKDSPLYGMPILNADKSRTISDPQAESQAGLCRRGQRPVLRQEDDDGLRRRQEDPHRDGAVAEEVVAK